MDLVSQVKNSNEVKMTPLMMQYWEMKNAHPDKILLFRMGDFFEMFHDDAVVAAPLLGIALTSRNKKAQDETPMCGVPHHAIATPINKLLKAGYKVAICDQVEDPKLAKGLVKRAVTRVLSPGMVYDPESLDVYAANYIACLCNETLAFLEPTTGECFYYEVTSSKEISRIMKVLNPAEVLLVEGGFSPATFAQEYGDSICKTLYAGENISEKSLLKSAPQLAQTIPLSARYLVNYAVEMQGEMILQTLSQFEKRKTSQFLWLGAQVVKHLEFFETYKGERRGSLIAAIDRTKTSAGARLLRRWLSFPLTDINLMTVRWNRIEYWMKHMMELEEVRRVFASMGDIERRLGKISNPNCGPRDLIALSDSLKAGMSVTGLSQETKYSVEALRLADYVVQKIDRMIELDAPLSSRSGGIIQKGVREELDELIVLSTDAQSLLQKMEEEERAKTGINSLKFRYNNVFGYFIEITKTHTDKVPAHYMRKQSLVNAERYTTDELNQLEAKVLSARTRRAELEFEIFEELRLEVLSKAVELLRLASEWSELDVISSLAWLALEENYVRPEVLLNHRIEILGSRHPVIEQSSRGVGSRAFVANDIVLDRSNCLLLTGPNMAGKSTLMRQVAISVVMAQMGSFVPASSAKLPLFERVFTRIGASDSLSEGLSTFMVEMTETAEMLREADEKSLVVLDEVGRGTSTFDGMSLAQSILEYLLETSRATTLFATHYHELTAMQSQYAQIQNAHMAIHEKNGAITFLHSLVAGAASKSYGIQVAQLAGLPPAVTKRAQKILNLREAARSDSDVGVEIGGAKGTVVGAAMETPQLSLFEASVGAETEVRLRDDLAKKEALLALIDKIDLAQTTPMQALQIVDQIQTQMRQ